jgi:hypothetical protein
MLSYVAVCCTGEQRERLSAGRGNDRQPASWVGGVAVAARRPVACPAGRRGACRDGPRRHARGAVRADHRVAAAVAERPSGQARRAVVSLGAMPHGPHLTPSGQPCSPPGRNAATSASACWSCPSSPQLRASAPAITPCAANATPCGRGTAAPSRELINLWRDRPGPIELPTCCEGTWTPAGWTRDPGCAGCRVPARTRQLADVARNGLGWCPGTRRGNRWRQCSPSPTPTAAPAWPSS